MNRTGQRVTAALVIALAGVVGVLIGLELAKTGHSHRPSASGTTSTTSSTTIAPAVTMPPTRASLPETAPTIALAELPVAVSGGRVEVVPSSVVSDCSVDVTVPLDRWLRGVPDDSTVVFRSGSCYQVDGTVAVVGKRQVVLEGQGVRIVQRAAAGPKLPASLYPSADGRNFRRGFLVSQSSDVTLSGFSLQGYDTSGRYVVRYANENGVHISDSDRVLVEAMTISGVYGDGVAVTDASQNVTVEHLDIPLAGRNSMSDYSGSGVTFEDNRLGSCHFVHLDVEPFPVGGVARSAQDVVITRNVLSGAGSFFSDLGAQSATVDDIEVSYNTSSGPIGVEVGGGQGPSTVMRHTIEVIGNDGGGTSNGGPRGLMCFTNVEALVVSGNYQRFDGHPAAVAVAVSNSDGISVEGNWFPDAAQLLNTATKPVALAAAANAGQSTVNTATPPVDLKAYQIGNGADTEIFNVVTYHGHGPFVLTLGQKLKHDYPAGQHLVTAPSSNYQQTDNSTTNTAPAHWS